MVLNKINYQYFRITDDRQKWLGNRYFKVDMAIDHVVQVCVSVGETKKGRGHTFGVYLISRMTFFANYLAMQYAVPCTKTEYNKNFKKVFSHLL